MKQLIHPKLTIIPWVKGLIRCPPLARVFLLVPLLLTMIAAAPAARASIIPRDSSTSNGNDYGDWSVLWWQWLLSIPAATNPALDSTGANCGQKQAGPLWFLAGNFGGPAVTRDCTVPAGKSIFFPLVNAIFGAGVGDCSPTNPRVPCNLADLRVAATASMDSVTLEADLDGTPLDVSNQRVQSPEFTVTYPNGNIVGVVRAGNVGRGTFMPNVGDGYWVMLTPLSPGSHTLHWRAEVTGGPFAGEVIEVTYHLTQE
jgi:hypothetical protein